MELKILGSSSTGNCYVFDNGKEALIIECGVPFQDVKKAVNFNISRIVGCLVSHEHSDHAKYVQNFIDARIDVWMSKGTALALSLYNPNSDKSADVLEYGISVNIANFNILPFKIQHDAAEPFGFLIHHAEMGTVLFATDCNELPYTFNGLNNILIECNHSVRIAEDKLHRGMITEAQSVRTLRNHMSYETCMQTLLENDLSAVNNIVLIHLSDSNSNAVEFQQGIQEATRKTVCVANKGMVLNFNKTPFL
jgi:phosphoribosyl 1,2-cyclic phosphodiesterase